MMVVIGSRLRRNNRRRQPRPCPPPPSPPPPPTFPISSPTPSLASPPASPFGPINTSTPQAVTPLKTIVSTSRPPSLKPRQRDHSSTDPRARLASIKPEVRVRLARIALAQLVRLELMKRLFKMDRGWRRTAYMRHLDGKELRYYATPTSTRPARCGRFRIAREKLVDITRPLFSDE